MKDLLAKCIVDVQLHLVYIKLQEKQYTDRAYLITCQHVLNLYIGYLGS